MKFGLGFAAFLMVPSLALANICSTQTLAGFLPEVAPETCGTAQALDGSLEDHCAWRFALVSVEAQLRFTELKTALAKCASPAPADLRVNHPDSYDLQVFTTDTQRISLSLKEKYALDARYIFLRRTR